MELKNMLEDLLKEALSPLFKEQEEGIIKRLLREFKTAEEDKIFGVKDLASYLGVPQSWVYEHKHELPHFRAGNRIKFKKKDIDRWIEERKIQPIRRK